MIQLSRFSHFPFYLLFYICLNIKKAVFSRLCSLHLSPDVRLCVYITFLWDVIIDSVCACVCVRMKTEITPLKFDTTKVLSLFVDVLFFLSLKVLNLHCQIYNYSGRLSI